MKASKIKRKFLFVTGSRSDFGILYPLIREFQLDSEIELKVIVTGNHHSINHGNTKLEVYENVKNENIINVEINVASDTNASISNTFGLGVISFSNILESYKPDICIVLGDRFEIFSFVCSAMLHRVPIAHISGGEHTEGAIDESIRHSITKMSHIHFVTTAIYKKRLIQLGENPNYVFNFGSPSVDNIIDLKPLTKLEIEKKINFNLERKIFLITYHPVTIERNNKKDIEELLLALEKFNTYSLIFTKPNNDHEGDLISEKINEFISLNPMNRKLIPSMGTRLYLSILNYVEIVIGNSSSGIVEVPFYKIPTINIGNRQKGRIKAKSVIDCSNKKSEIEKSIKKALSTKFKVFSSDVKNPYGNKKASPKIKNILKKINLEGILKKPFHDIKF